jgi:hypothetical protein
MGDDVTEMPGGSAKTMEAKAKTLQTSVVLDF